MMGGGTPTIIQSICNGESIGAVLVTGATSIRGLSYSAINININKLMITDSCVRHTTAKLPETRFDKRKYKSKFGSSYTFMSTIYYFKHFTTAKLVIVNNFIKLTQD